MTLWGLKGDLERFLLCVLYASQNLFVFFYPADPTLREVDLDVAGEFFFVHFLNYIHEVCKTGHLVIAPFGAAATL